MNINALRLLCSVIRVDIVYGSEEGTLTPCFDAAEASPLMKSASLRDTLRSGALTQDVPYIHKGAEDCYFAGIISGSDIVYMGPMCNQKLNVARMQRMVQFYGLETSGQRQLPTYTLPEIRNMVLLTDAALGNIGSIEKESAGADLLEINRLIAQNDRLYENWIRRDQSRSLIAEDEENDQDFYRHSYSEEQMVVQAVKEGRSEDAIRISENMDRDSGRIGTNDLQHRRNMAIVAITVCSRAAIEAGVSPEAAYRISGYYMMKCDAAHDPSQMLVCRNKAIEDLSAKVRDVLSRKHYSVYTEKCIDYVQKNYRSKIYLDDIADALSVSPSYLSRLFHSETGQRLQDYINLVRVERAARLLIYSDMSLSEISDYVGFPNQSYFGKIFSQYKKMTPRKYREANRNTEYTAGR